MATTEITVEQVVRTGLNATYNAAASGDGNVFNNISRKAIIHVVNASGGSVDVTISTPNTQDGLAVADRVVAVPAGEDRFIGAWTSMYEGVDADNSIDQAVTVTFSATASVTIACFRI